MAFKAGAIVGEAILDTGKWDRGLKNIQRGAGVALAAAGAAFVAFGVKATKEANEFQKEMSNVNTLLDETVTSTADLTKQLLQLDPTLGKTTELTKGLYQAFSAGAEDATEAMQITTDAAVFAGAAITDMNAAVDVLTTATNAYGNEVLSSTQASDIFFTTIKQGKINGEQLSSSIGKSISLFAGMKIGLDELGSAMATMTKLGVSASESTTGLNAIVRSFIKPSADMAAALKEVGFESGAAFIEAEGFGGALKFLEDQTGGNKDSLTKLLPELEALRAAMVFSGEGGKIFAENMIAMGNASGETRKAFEKQEKTFATFVNQMNKFEIVAGNIIKFFADDVFDAMTKATKGATDFLMSTEGMNTVANIVGNMAGAFNALKVFMEPITNVVGPALAEIVTTLVNEFGDANEETSLFNQVLVGLTKSINVTALGMGVFFDIIKMVISNFSELTSTIMSGAKVIGTAFDVIRRKASTEELSKSFSDFKDSFGILSDSVVDSSKVLADSVSERWKVLEENSKETTENIKRAFITSSRETKNGVVSNWEEMFTGQKDLTNDMIANATETGEQINNATKDFASKNQKEWKDHWDEVVSTISSFANLALDVIDFGLNSFSSILNMQLDNQEQMIEHSYNERITPIQEAFDTEIELLREKGDLLEEALETEIDLLTDAKDERMWLLDEEKDALEIKYEEDLARLKAENLDDETFNAKKKALSEKRRLDIKFNSLEQSKIAREFAQEKKKREDEETANIAKNKAEQNRIEKEFNDKKARLEAERNAELNDAAKKRFETQKSLDIANVWTNAASSIMGWWSKAPILGPFAGPIFAGVMSGATLGVAGVQTSLINQQQFVPAFQEGGTASGISRINEAGGEILNLPDGTIVVPNDISRQIAAASGNNNSNVINISFAGANIGNRREAEDIVDIIDRQLALKIRGMR